MSTTLTPSARSRRISSQVARRPCGSMPAVGSSRNSSSGRPTSAIASDSRCCWPPDSRLTGMRAAPASPTSSSSSPTGQRVRGVAGEQLAAARTPGPRCNRRRRPAASPRPEDAAGHRRATGSRPSTRTVPASGRRKPSQISMVVVLPAPLVPSRASSCPRGTVSEIPSTAVREPLALDQAGDLDGSGYGHVPSVGSRLSAAAGRGRGGDRPNSQGSLDRTRRS